MEEQLIENDLATGGVSYFDEEIQPYNLAATEYSVVVNPYPQLKTPIFTTHVVRRPTFEEEERRERMMPLVTKEAGKVEGETASQTEIDPIPADSALYDKTIKRIYGYTFTKGEKPAEDGLDPHSLVTSPNGHGELKEMKVYEAIPASHKSLVMQGLYPSVFEIQEVEVDAFVLGAAREWTIVQEMGGRQKLEDGTLSKPDYVIKYTFREPTAEELRKFRSSAFSAMNWRDKDGNQRERRTLVLKVVSDLFDSLLYAVDGVSIDRGASSEKFDVRNREHLKLIPSNFKKGAMLKLFTFLQADLGNSQSA